MALEQSHSQSYYRSMVECFSDSNDIKVVTFAVQIQSKNSLADCNHLIRLGTPGDGGYVICSESVKHCNKLLSFGISDNWSFESGFFLWPLDSAGRQLRSPREVQFEG